MTNLFTHNFSDNGNDYRIKCDYSVAKQARVLRFTKKSATGLFETINERKVNDLSTDPEQQVMKYKAWCGF